MRNIGRIDTKSIASRYGLYKVQLKKATRHYYIMAYRDASDIGLLIGLLYPYRLSDGTEVTLVEAFYPENAKSKKVDVTSVEEAIERAIASFVRDRRYNPDFFTDQSGRVHPIRKSEDYDPGIAGESVFDTKKPQEMTNSELLEEIKKIKGKERLESPFFLEYERRGQMKMGSQFVPAVETKVTLGGFEKTLSPAQSVKAIEQMNTLRMISGQSQTRKAYIEKAVASGATVGTRERQRALILPSGSYMLERDITKTALDYAQYLLAKKAS